MQFQLIIICLVMMSDVIRGQDIKPLIMCEDERVTVSTGSSGVIKHTPRVGAPATTCSLTMTADSGSYISIPGVESLECVSLTNAAISIDGQPHCVRKFSPGVIKEFSNTKRSISITTRSNSSGFTLEFLNTVAVCGTNISIPDRAEVDRLSGIISSSYTPSIVVSLPCTTTVTNLPSGVVRFDILSSILGSRNKLTVGTQEVADTTRSYLVNTTSGEISIRYTPYVDGIGQGVAPGSFLIKFTVLTCGDAPQVLNTTSSTSTTPWFPGSKVTYTCKDNNYQLKKPVPTVECKVDNMEAKWVNQSEIKCIPVPYCLDGPYDVVYATHSRPDSHTAIYQCLKGYADTLKTEVTSSTCASKNNDTKPWIWSTVSLNCTPVECKVEKLSLNPTTTNITSTGDINGRYYYQDVVTYECTFGYKKEDQKEEIHCQSDSTWSGTPVCTQMAECSRDRLNITNGDIKTRRYYRGDTLRYECDDGYKKSVDNVLCQDTGNWSLTPVCLVDDSDGNDKVTTEGGTNQKLRVNPLIGTIIGGVVGLVLLVGTVTVVVLVMRRRKVHLPCITSPSTDTNEYEDPQSIGFSNPVNRGDNTYMSLQGDRSSNTYDSLQTQSDGNYENIRDRDSAAYVNVDIRN